RQRVALACVAVLQRLPARQRAVLLLREVAGYSAEEVAEILEITVAAANSALQRAREVTATAAAPADDAPDPGLLARFVRACETRDVDALIELVTRDVALAMPPLPLWLSGADELAAFARGVLFAAPTMRDQRLIATRANGGPAFGVYARDEHGVYVPAALQVVVVRGGAIAELHAYLAIGDFVDFARFGLPGRVS